MSTTKKVIFLIADTLLAFAWLSFMVIRIIFDGKIGFPLFDEMTDMNWLLLLISLNFFTALRYKIYAKIWPNKSLKNKKLQDLYFYISVAGGVFGVIVFLVHIFNN